MQAPSPQLFYVLVASVPGDAPDGIRVAATDKDTAIRYTQLNYPGRDVVWVARKDTYDEALLDFYNIENANS